MLRELPPVPVAGVDGVKLLRPADSFSAQANSENTELYAVFPFRYLFDYPLLQKRMDGNPGKLAFYYENLLYFQGQSEYIWDPSKPEETARIRVPRRGRGNT